jgi:hypothetical protein
MSKTAPWNGGGTPLVVQRKHTMPTTSVDVSNLLLGLAWLGELDRRQIQRLWFGGKSESTVEKTLARLAKDGLIMKRAWSIYDEQRKVTAPQLARWSLTPAGHALVKASDQYPAKPVQVRQQRLIAHDAPRHAAGHRVAARTTSWASSD